MNKYIIYTLLLFSNLCAHAQEMLSLEECRNRAIEHSDELKIAQFQFEKAKAERAAMKTHYLPSLAGSANGVYLHKNIEMELYLPTVVPNPTTGELVPNVMANPTTGEPIVGADGNPIFKTSHLFGFFGTLNPQTVDRIDFYKGSFPAKYGGKLSSVIDVTTRKPNLDSLNLELELSPITGKIFAELPIVKKRNAIWISSRTTLFDKALRAARHNSPHSIMGFSDFQFKAYHEQNPRSRFSLNGYLDSDYFKDQYNVVDTIKDVSQLTWRNKFASFDHQYDFNDKQQIRTTIGTSEYFYRIDHQEGISKNSIEERKQMTTTINRLYTKLEFSTKSKSGIQTDVGLNYEIFKNLALKATIIVLKLIKTAPAAGLSIIPNIPAANGIAIIL